MLKNYLKTAFRNLKRNKSYAIINVLGLAVGIAACLLIYIVLSYETSFDNYHQNKSSIYRLGSEFHNADGVGHSTGIPFPVGPALRIDFPEMQVGCIARPGKDLITILDEKNNQVNKFNEDVYFAEPQFFKILNFGWLAGDPFSALSQPNNAVLTEAIANKYFGDWKSAIGKTIKRNNDDKEIFKVTGILKNPPVNTDFPLTIVASYASLKNTDLNSNLNDWVSTFSDAYCFVILPKGLTPDKFQTQLDAFVNKHKPADFRKDRIILQAFKDIHYDERFGNYRSHTFSKSLIAGLSIIGLFLLIIACVNFINLATAQAVNRSREVGVRKVLGGSRKQLVFQFLAETATITITALILAIIVGYAVVPFLNQLLEAQMNLNIITHPYTMGFLLGITVLVILLSGLYPALILSGFNPITALRNSLTRKTGGGGISLRRALVVFQFVIAHVLIIGTLIVVAQMRFFKNASLGFDKAAIINIPIPGDSISHTKIDFLRNKLSGNSNIKSVSFSFATPSSESNWNSDFKFDNSPTRTNFPSNLKWTDVNYFNTYNLSFVAGRPFYPSDTIREFVVNETLTRKLGFRDPKEILGKKINFWDGVKTGPVVGVIRDFNSYSLRRPMAAVVMSTWKELYQVINIKIMPGHEKEVLSYTEKLWNQTFPSYVYEYHFLDKTIEDFYKQENQLSQLYKLFAGLAIFISCLGLYGLISFMAAQRTKELGIRKVLGASVADIVYLLSREFTLLIIIAFFIAGPIAYLIMSKWLENYTYRIHPGAFVFVSALIGSIIISWITVGHRAVQAAIANPVKSLRTE